MIGIDKWAWKRGRTYGTILCDLERRRVLDFLPDREPYTVSAWLKRHQGLAVIARDRATVFAQAMRDGAPQAAQAADRWHLLHNLGEALRAAVGRHRRAVADAGGIERSKPDEWGLHKVPVCHLGVDEVPVQATASFFLQHRQPRPGYRGGDAPGCLGASATT